MVDMPAPLALIFCALLVLFLLWLERRAFHDVSPALWIPTLWMMSVSSKPLAIWFGVAGNNESGSAVDELVLLGLSIAGIIVLVRRQFDWVSALRRHGWLLALLVFMLASTIWSDITLIAARRWARQIIILIMAFVVMSEADPRRAMESILRRLAYVLIPFSLVLIKYYPALGVDYSESGVTMWTGVAVHKNGFGSLCSISALFLVWARYRHPRERTPEAERYLRWADISIVLSAGFLLSGAQKNSATAAGTLIVGAVILLTLRVFQKLKLRVPQAGLLVLVISLIGYGVLAPFMGGENLAGFSSSLGRDSTLTGRTEIWESVLPAMKEQPLLGYGVGSFWTTSRRELYDISDGHNGYLDVLLELGAVGLGLYSAWLLSCARGLHKTLAMDYDWGSLAISFLIMTLVFNATESTLSGLAEQLTAVAALSCLVGSYQCLCRPSPPTLQSSPSMELDRLSGTGFDAASDFAATAEEISWDRRSNPDASTYRWAE